MVSRDFACLIAPGDRPRFRAAERLLQSAASMVAVERAVAGLELDGPPSARCFARGRPLASATRIGLFSGSFNPVTAAHLAVADAARAQGRLDALVWAEALVTVDKEGVTRASLPDRLAQLVALARPRGESVAALNRGLYVEQARALRAVAPQGARVFVVVGFDKIVQIFDPRYYPDRDAALGALFAEADVLVAPRGEAGRVDLARLLARPENRRFAPHITPLDLPGVYSGESSTRVRGLAAQPAAHWGELERLVPPEALALVATRAYIASDWYALRLAWLAALRPFAARALRHLPPLDALVGLVLAAADTGAREALLAAGTHPSRPEVVALLRSLGALPPELAQAAPA